MVPLPKSRYPDGDSLLPDSLAVLLRVPGAVLLNVVSKSTHEAFLCFGSSHTSLRSLTHTGLGSCPKSWKFISSHLDTSPVPILSKFSAEFGCQFRTQNPFVSFTALSCYSPSECNTVYTSPIAIMRHLCAGAACLQEERSGGHSTGGRGERMFLQHCRLTFATCKNVGWCSYLSTSFSYNLVPLPTCISAHNLCYFTYRV